MNLGKVEYHIDENDEWISEARVVRSPNFDARPVPEDIELLVIHGISLPPREYGGCFIDQLFTNCLNPEQHPYFAEIQHLQVSSHLLIDRQGHLTQYVPLRDRAWHAGESSFKGREKCNDFSIGIELEGCDEDAYCDVQYKKLAEITNVICGRWQKITKDRIVGHCDIAPGRKTDPGPAFNWDYYYSLIKL